MGASDWTCPEDRFPIMFGGSRYGERKLTVPLALVLEHEKQALANHSQSVARLKERGGLSWCELSAVLGDRQWFRMDTDNAHEHAMRRVLVWQQKQRAAALPAPPTDKPHE
jgi:hypothetical protein